MSMPPADPHLEYSGRLESARGQLSRLDRRHRALGYAKLIIGLATLIVAVWLLKFHARYIAFFLVPAAGYVVLAILHERVIRARRRSSRIIAFYERGLARLGDNWPGTGNTASTTCSPIIPMRAIWICSGAARCLSSCARHRRRRASKLWPTGC